MRVTVRVESPRAGDRAACAGDLFESLFVQRSRRSQICSFVLSAALHGASVACILVVCHFVASLDNRDCRPKPAIFVIGTPAGLKDPAATVGEGDLGTALRHRAVRIVLTFRAGPSLRDSVDGPPKLVVSPRRSTAVPKPGDASNSPTGPMLPERVVTSAHRPATLPTAHQRDLPDPQLFRPPLELDTYRPLATYGIQTSLSSEPVRLGRVPKLVATLPRGNKDSSEASSASNRLMLLSTSDAPELGDNLSSEARNPLLRHEAQTVTAVPPGPNAKIEAGARGADLVPAAISHDDSPPGKAVFDEAAANAAFLPLANNVRRRIELWKPSFISPMDPSFFRRMDHPVNGRFDMVIVQPSLGDVVPEAAGLLRGRPVNTVYLEVGDSKEWVMHYAAADTAVVQRGAVVQLPDPRRLAAPYPRVTFRPAEPLVGSAPYVYVHGMIDETGSLHELRVLGSEQESTRSLLAALARWLFRPGSKGDSPATVEVILAIPVNKS
jgi:hypothetical protein